MTPREPLKPIPFNRPGAEPPANIGCEQTLLGTLMARPKLLDSVGDLRPEHFYDPLHRRLFAQIAARIVKTGSCDALSLLHMAQTDEDLKARGGIAYLSKLEGRLNPLAVTTYSDMIRQTWQKRELIEIHRQGLEDAHNPEVDFATASARLEKGLTRAIDGLDNPEGADFYTSLTLGLQRIREAIDRDGPGGLTTGLYYLDRMVPLLPGNMYVFGGATSSGKSALVWGMAINAARKIQEDVAAGKAEGGCILGISQEMTKEDLALRAACVEAMVTYEDATSGFPAPDGMLAKSPEHRAWQEAQFAKLQAAQESLGRLPIYYEDFGRLSPARMKYKARALRRRYKHVNAVILDHLQHTKDDEEGGRGTNQIANKAETVHAVMQMAKELKCPVLALSQLSRDVDNNDDQRPQIKNLAWSSAIEQDATAVILLHRAEYWLAKKEPLLKGGKGEGAWREAHDAWREQMEAADGRADLFIDKNRGGRTGHLPMFFTKETMRFDEDIAGIKYALDQTKRYRSSSRQPEPPPYRSYYDQQGR